MTFLYFKETKKEIFAFDCIFSSDDIGTGAL